MPTRSIGPNVHRTTVRLVSSEYTSARKPKSGPKKNPRKFIPIWAADRHDARFSDEILRYKLSWISGSNSPFIRLRPTNPTTATGPVQAFTMTMRDMTPKTTIKDNDLRSLPPIFSQFKRVAMKYRSPWSAETSLLSRRLSEYRITVPNRLRTREPLPIQPQKKTQ